MPSWKTLAFYIARQFLLWCFVVFAAMTSIVFLLDYVELIRRGGTRPGATLAVLLEMAALKQPYMAQQIMPFAILFGAMLAFWRMTRSNELVVARSAGVSVWQFLTPPVLSALAIGIAMVTVFNPIASATRLIYDQLENRVLRNNGEQLTLSRSGLYSPDFQKYDAFFFSPNTQTPLGMGGSFLSERLPKNGSCCNPTGYSSKAYDDFMTQAAAEFGTLTREYSPAALESGNHPGVKHPNVDQERLVPAERCTFFPR